MKKFVGEAGAGKISSPADIFNAVLPSWLANLYLVVVLAAIYVCCLAIQTSTIRLAFGMSRDGKLPFARFYNKVSPSLHTPVGVCLVVGLLAAIPFLYYAGAGTIAISATGMIYLSYFLGNIAILRARSKGWPRDKAPFKLGGWGVAVNILALVYGGFMLINFLWPRPGSIINPSVSALPNIPNLGPLGNIPIFEATVGVLVIIGAIYYLVAQRGKSDQLVRAA
jgi:amino acid transporter